MSVIDKRLEELGITLPPPARSVGHYVPYTRAGNIVISVQGPLWGDELRYQGRLGETFTLEDGQEAARLVMLNLLCQVRPAVATSTGCASACGWAASSIPRPTSTSRHWS